MTVPNTDIHNTNARLAKLEAGQAATDSELANLARAVDRMGDSLERLGSRVSERSNTNWGVLGTWTAVMVTIIGGLGTLAMLPLSASSSSNKEEISALESRFTAHIQDGHPRRVEQQTQSNLAHIEELKKELADHVAADGHPKTVARLDGLIKSYDEVRILLRTELSQLDTNLQREMRDLDTGMKGEIDKRLDSLDKLLQTEIREAKLIMDARSTGRNNAQGERLRALERAVFGRTDTWNRKASEIKEESYDFGETLN